MFEISNFKVSNKEFYETVEIDSIPYEVTGYYSYTPGTSYLPNGEPGYPPEMEVVIKEVSSKDKIIKETEWRGELEDKLIDAVSNKLIPWRF